jgi:hypothetical protein
MTEKMAERVTSMVAGTSMLISSSKYEMVLIMVLIFEKYLDTNCGVEFRRRGRACSVWTGNGGGKWELEPTNDIPPRAITRSFNRQIWH